MCKNVDTWALNFMAFIVDAFYVKVLIWVFQNMLVGIDFSFLFGNIKYIKRRFKNTK